MKSGLERCEIRSFGLRYCPGSPICPNSPPPIPDDGSIPLPIPKNKTEKNKQTNKENQYISFPDTDVCWIVQIIGLEFQASWLRIGIPSQKRLSWGDEGRCEEVDPHRWFDNEKKNRPPLRGRMVGQFVKIWQYKPVHKCLTNDWPYSRKYSNNCCALPQKKRKKINRHRQAAIHCLNLCQVNCTQTPNSKKESKTKRSLWQSEWEGELNKVDSGYLWIVASMHLSVIQRGERWRRIGRCRLEKSTAWTVQSTE